MTLILYFDFSWRESIAVFLKLDRTNQTSPLVKRLYGLFYLSSHVIEIGLGVAKDRTVEVMTRKDYYHAVLSYLPHNSVVSYKRLVKTGYNIIFFGDWKTLRIFFTKNIGVLRIMML